MDMENKSKRVTGIMRYIKYHRLQFLRKIRRFSPWHSLHWVLVLVILLPLLTMYGCNKLGKTKSSKQTPAVAVLTGKVSQKDIPLYLAALGTVTPVNGVTVMTQVDGQVLTVNFNDGQMVQVGDLLVELDPQPYRALLTQYEGQLVRDRALLANARIDLDRYKTLFAQDSTSQQTLATQMSLVKQYEGAVKSDLGQIAAAKVDLEYCKITAPIAGKLGISSINVGQIVHTTDTTGIVVVNAMDPMYVDFAIPEDNIQQVATKMSTGEQLIVYAQDRAQLKTIATGKLLTTDNQINTSTGTLGLRAQFDNKDQLLFPNQFVNVQLLIDILYKATVVPTAAVQYGTQGTYIYVVNADNTVTLHNVKIAGSVDDETAIIADIKPGETVVVEGTDKLKNGTLITVLQPNNNQGNTNSGSV